MKLTRIMFGAALMLASSWCFAGATEDLLARSRALKTMSADFHVVITDEDGLELETYDGRIRIETAAKSFRLDTAEPEANAVVCNGKELYSYDPSVAQVTILSFDKIVDAAVQDIEHFITGALRAAAGQFPIAFDIRPVLFHCAD